MRKKLTPENIKEIIHSYEKLLIPMAEIGEKYGITRQRVWQILKEAGISKNGEIEVSCEMCRKKFKKYRHRIRKNFHNFCSPECYYKWRKIKSDKWKPWKHGLLATKRIIQNYFVVQNGHVIFWVDGDKRNNSIENLKVFASKEDCLKFHKGFNITPLWDGSKKEGNI